MTRQQDQSYLDKLSAAAEFMRKHDDFLVVSHVSPDGDAASSTAVVGWILSKLNKRFLMVNEGAIPSKFDYMWGFSAIRNATVDPMNRVFEHIISIDCADYQRIGSVSQSFAPDAMLLNIDHHATNDDFGTVNLVRSDAAATAEVLYDLVQHLEIPMDAEVANAIYTGLLTDTGGFRYSNTTPAVMSIASDLLKHGAEGFKLAEHLLESLSYSHVLLLKKALNTLSFSSNRTIAWLQVTLEDLAETGASNEDLEGLVNYPRNIEGVEVGVLFKEAAPDRVKVSLRSAGRIDVAAIAQQFGGGGHIKAAGCSLSCTIEDAVKQVIDTIHKEMSA